MSGLRARFPHLGVVLAFLAAWSAAAGQEIRIVRTDPAGLVLELSAPEPLLSAHPSQPGRVEARLAGLPTLDEEGMPRLPYARRLIAVPEGMRPVLSIVKETTRRFSEERLAVLTPPFFGFTEEEGWKPPADPPLPGAEYPGVAAEIAWRGWMRDVQVAEVRFYPVRSAGERGGVLHHPYLEVRLDFVRDSSAKRPRSAGAAAGAPRPDRYRDVQRRAVLNWEQVEPTLGRDVAPVEDATEASAAGEPSLQSGPQPLKIGVKVDGLYGIQPADLASAGIDPNSVDPRDFRLEFMGAPIPVEVLGESDGVFDPNDRLVFMGRAATGLYTRTNVYWLHFDGGGARAASRDGTYGTPAPTAAFFATTARAEQNLVYTQNVPPGVTEHWWWKLQSAGDPNSGDVTYTVDVPKVDPTPHTIRVRVFLQGRTSSGLNPDHHTRIFLNGVQIDDRTWDGAIPLTHDVDVSSSLLVSGSNSLRCLMVGDTGATVDQVYFDRIQVDYNRTYAALSNALLADGEGVGSLRFAFTDFATSDIAIYEVTDPNGMVRIAVPPGQITGTGPYTAGFQDTLAADVIYAGATVAGLRSPASIVQDTPSSLASPANGADWIVVAPPEFAAALQPLIDLRASQGYRVLTALTDDIYDEFNHGIFSPPAIKDFLAYAYANYAGPAPEFVLLAGDAHIDYLDNLGSGVKQFVPAILVQISNFGQTPSDNEYVAVAGSDVLPEMFVGRLPARSSADVTAMVDKILAHEGSPPVADLNAQSLFVADNDDIAFTAVLDSLASLIPPTMAANKVYLPCYYDPVLHLCNPPSSAIAAARASIRSGMDAGALLTTFMGHGSATQWAAECIWASSGSSCGANDPNTLQPGFRTTFVAALNCINGYFVDLLQAGTGHVNYSLAEAMLRKDSRAAIAVLAPAALGDISDYSSIGDWLFRGLFLDRDWILGRASVSAIMAAVTQPINPADIDNVRELTYFGDPATDLALDSDGDGLIDRLEEEAAMNPLDGDSDDDGVPDGQEPSYAADADADGKINGLDPDADDDGVLDGTEAGVTVPPPGTDTGAGFFVPDADPNTTTDPLDADTDGGGAADGAEDRNFNGRLDPGETDPTAGHAADDQVCASALPEISDVRVSASGADLLLTWNSLTATHPCALYRVYVADNVGKPKSSFAPYHLLALTSGAGYTHAGAVTDGKSHDYLVVAFDPLTGEGPVGHYGR